MLKNPCSAFPAPVGTAGDWVTGGWTALVCGCG